MAEDDKRFEALFSQNFGHVLAYATRRCPSREDAEDVVAETFAVAWRRLDDLPEGHEARLWLFGTARLIRSNRIRGHGRRQRLLDRLRHRVRSHQAPGVDGVVVAHQALRQAMSALSEADREILGLHAWEGLTAEEIATTLELIRHLQQADPAAGADRDPHGPTGHRLRQRARQITLIAVAALLGLSTVAAAAMGVFDPDPADVSAILEDAAPAYEVHLDGWRPSLSSEGVWCFYENGAGANTIASEFSLDQPRTRDGLIQECTAGNDTARNLASPPTETTLCGGTLTDVAVQERLDASGARIVSGSLEGPRAPFPVVLGWQADCEAIDLDRGPPIILHELDSLAAINRAREVEVVLKAAATRGCLSRDQVDELVADATEQLGPAWLVTDESRPDARCFEAWVEPEISRLAIVGLPGPCGSGCPATPADSPTTPSAPH